MNKYISLYREIKDSILRGDMQPNAQLKSKRRMAKAKNYSIKTVENAYNLLIEEGYIYTKEKSGYYVTDNKYFQVSHHLAENPQNVIKDDVLYDFTSSHVDSSLFPYYTFKKITSYIINNEPNVWLTKAPLQGDVSLRETLSDYLYEYKGMRVSYNNIIIVSSIEESLDILNRILDIKYIGLENPGYPKIKEYFSDKIITYYPVDPEGIVLDKDIHQDMIYVTPYNQFPMGVKMSVKRRKQLLSYDTDYIFEDDFDCDLIQENKVMSTLYSLNNQKVIYHGSFSHTLCPGLRISYLILPDELLQKYYKLKGSSHISSFDQTLMNTFIKEGYYYRHINHIRKEMAQKRIIIEDYLKKNNMSYIKRKLAFFIPVDHIKKCSSVKVNYLNDYLYESLKQNYLILNYMAISKENIILGLQEIKEKII